MKKIVLIFVCLTAIVCRAQNHLKFMDIPISGSIEEFANKLFKKGLTLHSNKQDFDNSYCKWELITLVGRFETFDNCMIDVRSLEGVNETSSIYVIIDSLNNTNGKIDKLVDKYDKKYGEHINYKTMKKWNCDDGCIYILKRNGSYVVEFRDKPEEIVINSILERMRNESTVSDESDQIVKEICGVPFGSSYEKTKEILENKYGYSALTSDRMSIDYKNITYAGFTFDSIHFLFQSEGISSYLNGCIFIMRAKSLSDAKRKQEMLYKKLSEKYLLLNDTDDNGNKYYYGGYSPIPDDGVGLHIDIVKYEGDVAKNYNPYAARLAYGRYNYVKEDF